MAGNLLLPPKRNKERITPELVVEKDALIGRVRGVPAKAFAG